MVSKQKNEKYASMCTEAGFTMLEMLYAFAMFCTITFFFPMIIQVMYANNLDEEMQHLEWEVFVNQIKKEIRTVNDVYVVNNMLVLEKDNKLITYEKYEDKLRRRVDRTGHEVLLQNVRQVSFEQLMNGVKLTVVATDDRTYEVNVRSYLQLEGSEPSDSK